MDLTSILGGVFLLIVAVFATRELGRVWSGESRTLGRGQPSWWLWGGMGWKRVRRAAPVAVIGGWPMGVFLVVTGVAGQGEDGYSGVVGAAVYVFGGLFGLSLLLVFSTAFLGQPKKLIPPDVRD